MAASTTAAKPAVPTVPKPRPYRRYLTSALHTRFVHAVLLSSLNALPIVFLTGKGERKSCIGEPNVIDCEQDYFWSWFPVGPAGVKAALFTLTSLFVFILQLATLQVGQRTSTSFLKTLRTLFFNVWTYQTFFWYIVSAWWFCEAYIWAVPENHNMGWILRHANGPDRLNERPIYLRFFFTIIAIVHSGLHLYYGLSYLHIPVASLSTSQEKEQPTHLVLSRQRQLRDKLWLICFRSVMTSGLATVTAPFIYKAFFRDAFWSIHLAFAKPFFDLPRSEAHPPNTYFIGSILGWAFVIGLALGFTWEIAAHAFLIYMKQPPLKNGLPLSAASKDPNGTLLSGLIAKRSLVRTFALWELCLIAQNFPDRRRAIFADFERSSGPMWTSMLKAALSAISDIDSRILALNPEPPRPAKLEEQQITTLPRIANNASNQKVMANLAPASSKKQVMENFIAATNKAIGQSQNPWSPPINETTQHLLEYTRSTVNAGGNELQQIVNNTFKTQTIADFFRVSSADKVASVILGNPAGNASIIVDAVEAITKMLIASLNEDNFGKVVQTVPESVKQFSRSILMIEGFIGTQSQDVISASTKELVEVRIVVSRLKASLRELLSAFQVFLNDAGLGIKDLNEARRAMEDRPLLPIAAESKPARHRPEMEQTSQKQQRQSNAVEGTRRHDDSRDKRAQETAQSLKRIEAQPRRQRVSSGDNNVFGARDFSSGGFRRTREVGMAR